MSRQQIGFTLIELVVVLAIVGIMAATALPRFIGLQTQARTAKAQAIFGSVKSAAALARANCLVELAGLAQPANCTANGGTTNMDGTAVAMLNQYPAASFNGIISAAQINAASDAVLITQGASAAGPITIDMVGGTGQNCRISYTAASRDNSGNLIVPVIELTTGGC